MEEKNIKTKYRDIEIVYDEYENRWDFTLRNKERYATSLKLAKEAIDKPAPVDKKNFTPIDVYVCTSYGMSGFKLAVVTSLSPSKYSYGRMEAWVTFKGYHTKKREKVNLDRLYLVSTHNTQVIGEIEANDKAIQNLNNLDGKLKAKMQPANIKAEDYD